MVRRPALATEALRADVGCQVPGPPPRATGHSAAPRPDSTLQADLIGVSLNLPPTQEGNRYLAIVGDVFTREPLALPLSSKDLQTVATAAKLAIQNLRESTDENFTLLTDAGAEYSQLDQPEGAAHRAKDPNDR